MKLLAYDQLLYFWSKIKEKLALKVDKVDGKGLSTNDYTMTEKNKLAGIDTGANKTVVDSTFSSTSTNPVQNKVVKAELDKKATTTDLTNGLAGKANTSHGTHVSDVSGGSAGQVLKKTSSGYEWADDEDTVYTHPTSHSASMIDETDTRKFTSPTEKTAWNAKYDKPSDGIPKTDLDSDVQTSLGKADTALQNHQDISGKENSSNKVSSWSATTDNTHYPSEKLVKDSLDKKIETSTRGQANGVATLDSNGKVPSSQLPSYVDDVIEGYLYNGKFYKESAHTTVITGEGGKIYVDLTSNYSYRWSGSTYVKIESVDIELITNAEIDTILAS